MEIPIKDNVMLIDDEDYIKIKDLSIGLNKTSNKNTIYARSMIYCKGKYIKTIHIHRLVMGLDVWKNDKRIIHHKDGNGLNNQKDNLEICSVMYNSQTCRQKKKQGYIRYDTSMTRIKRWQVILVIMGVRHQKRFETREEAEEWLKATAPPDEIN